MGKTLCRPGRLEQQHLTAVLGPNNWFAVHGSSSILTHILQTQTIVTRDKSIKGSNSLINLIKKK